MRRNRVRVVNQNMFEEQENEINAAYLSMVARTFRSEFTRRSWIAEDKFIPPRIEFDWANRAVNAFAYENSDNKNRVLLTGGTIAYFSQDELMCIVAHELAHNYHKDFRNRNVMSTLLFIVAVSLTLILAFKFGFLFLVLFPPLLALLKYWVAKKSQSFEMRSDTWMLRIDAAAATRVIEKLGEFSQNQSSFFAMFETHPRICDRLKSLHRKQQL